MRIHDVFDVLEATRTTLSGSSFDDVNLSGTRELQSNQFCGRDNQRQQYVGLVH